MKSKAFKLIAATLCFVVLFSFTKSELSKNNEEQFTPDHELASTDTLEDYSAGDAATTGSSGSASADFDSRYDLRSESLDVNSLDFSGVTEISSADEWENCLSKCIAKDYHYVFFKAPSSLSVNLDKIMKTNQITAITIYTVPVNGEDKTITGYNFTYTYSHEILAAIDNGTTGSLDSKKQEALKTAQSFVSTLSGSDYDKELAIHNFVCAKITYSNDSSSSDITNCYGGLVLGSGNCQAYSDSFDLLCGLVDIPTGRIGCVANGTEHSLNYVQLGGQYYFVDCTFDDGISDLERGYGLFYFNLPYSVITQDHSFEYVPFALSQGLDYNSYYVKNNLYADSADSLTQIYTSLASNGTTGEILFNSANGDTALTDIFSANPCGYSSISTQKFTFGSYQILKFTLS
ncbi:MAG: hypothetical protein LUG24_08875 [Clostridiales bacterium]|nr:hypothetical protein [Clostridiales bacterium]